MSGNTIGDVDLVLDTEAKVESSAATQEEIIPNDVETQEAASTDQEIETEEVNSGDEQVEDVGLVKEDRKKPDGDIPRSRLNKEILSKKKEREEKERYKRERDELRQQLDGKPSPSSSPQSQAAPYPQESDEGIDFDTTILRQKEAEWHSNEVTRQMDARDAKKNAKAIKVKNTEKFQDFSAKISDYAGKNPEYLDDYQNAGDPSWPQHVTEALMHSDHGVAIDHHLLKNEDVRNKLIQMSPNQALMQLGRIENQLTSVRTKKAKPKQTKAPAAIDQSMGSSSGKSSDFMDDYDIE